MNITTKCFVLAAALLCAVAIAPGTASAVSCNGHTCDLVCPEMPGVLTNCSPSPNTFDKCDSGAAEDGFCVICGASSTGRNLIAAIPDGPMIVCGLGGADEIHGSSFADYIDGGTDDDDIDGNGGDDTIIGGSGNDTITGGGGDDYVDGGGGDDNISDNSGSNWLFGGTNDDTITTTPGTDAAAVFGSVLCGEGGKDTLNAGDYGVQCMDPGSGQGTTVFNDCNYTTPPGVLDSHDVGATAGTCKNVTPSTLKVRPTCGCS